MIRVKEIMSAQKVRGVAEKARAHRVALAGDRVCACSGATDLAGHEGQIDEGLGGAGGFMALVDSHRPPKRHPPPPMARFGKSPDFLHPYSAVRRHPLRN